MIMWSAALLLQASVASHTCTPVPLQHILTFLVIRLNPCPTGMQALNRSSFFLVKE